MCRSFCFLAESCDLSNTVIDRVRFRVLSVVVYQYKNVESNSAVIFGVGITCRGALSTEK